MIALDTNILVYAHRRDAEWHVPAAERVALVAEGLVPWAIPWPCIHEFFSIATNTRIYNPPSRTAEAIRQIEFWMEAPTLRLIGETEGHWPALKGLLLRGKIVGPAVHDARIAAICIAHGIQELWSADRDFSRLSGLTVRNP